MTRFDFDVISNTPAQRPFRPHTSQLDEIPPAKALAAKAPSENTRARPEEIPRSDAA